MRMAKSGMNTLRWETQNEPFLVDGKFASNEPPPRLLSQDIGAG